MSKVIVNPRFAYCVASVLLCVSGCTLGPQQIDNTRLKYNEAVQRTFQEEMLLNLVRLKYREIPEFLTVGGIAAQYTFEGSASAGLTIPEAGRNILGIDGGVTRSERPTISYAPARGEEFQKGLLAPIDLQTLQLLTRTGWRWDRILRTTVQYMNEVDNATSAGGPTPDKKPNFEEFRYLTQLLRQLQVQREIELVSDERDGLSRKIPFTKDQLGGEFVIGAIKEGFRIEESKEGLELVKIENYIALVVHPRAKYSREMQEAARILGLRVHYDSAMPEVYPVESSKEGRIQQRYKVAKIHPNARTSWVDHGDIHRLPSPKEPEDVANGQMEEIILSTRSLLEVMFYLSQGIEIPAEHQAKGLVTHTVDEAGNPFDWTEMTGDLLRVGSCASRPAHAAVAIEYKGYWFYIDDRDLNSQSTFTLLVELFGIEVRAGGGGGFLYTLNVGG